MTNVGAGAPDGRASWVNRLGIDVHDGLALIGFGALEYGVHQWSAPAAWVVGGIALIAVAIRPYLSRKVKR